MTPSQVQPPDLHAGATLQARPVCGTVLGNLLEPLPHFGSLRLGLEATARCAQSCYNLTLRELQRVTKKKKHQWLNGQTMPKLLLQCPELYEFQLLGRPRRTNEGELKVRTQRVVEGKTDLPRRCPDATTDCCSTVHNFLTHYCKQLLPVNILELD